MKIRLLLFCCYMLSNNAYSQQRPQLTQYMQNNFLANPAVAGIEDYGDVRTGFRRQWMGIDQAPTTFYASVHTALNKASLPKNASAQGQRRGVKNNSKSSGNSTNRFYRKPHHGVGAILQTDKAGNLRASTLNLSYAYHLPLSQRGTLAGGVSSGVTQLGFNRDWVVTHEDDFMLSSDLTNQWQADLGLGLWYYTENYYAGVSGTQLLGSINRKRNTDENSPDANLLYVLQPHYYLTAGYRWQVSTELTLAPSAILKYAASRQAALDLNLKALHAQGFWLGASYRHNDAMAAMLGIYLNHYLDISYSYDFSVSELREVNAVSHEVVLGFRFSNRGKILCPKYLW